MQGFFVSTRGASGRPRRRYAAPRGLLERIGEPDQQRLAASGTDECHAKGGRSGIEVVREGRAGVIRSKSEWDDDAWIAGSRGDVRAAVHREEQRVELVLVEGRVDATRTAELDVLRPVRLAPSATLAPWATSALAVAAPIPEPAKKTASEIAKIPCPLV